MATNFTGDLSLTGSLRSSLGIVYPTSGDLRLNVAATLDPAVDGRAAGSTASDGGLIVFNPANVYSSFYQGLLFNPPSFAMDGGAFTVQQTIPFDGAGVYLALTVTGTPGVVGGTILTTVRGSFSGVEDGISYSGTVAGSGTIKGVPIVAYGLGVPIVSYGLPVVFGGFITGATTPYAQAEVRDLDKGAPVTATVALASAAAGTLADPLGGSFNPTTGVFTVSGSPAEVTAALNALTFLPGDHFGPANTGVGTVLSLTLSDSAGGLAEPSRTSFQWTEPGLVALSTIDPAFLPKGPLTADAAGNLFGAATIRGVAGVFELPRVGDGYGAAIEVATVPAGLQPGLAVDPQGNIYAASYNGGTFGLGAIWEIPRSGGSFGAARKLADLYDRYAARPVGSLILDPEGNLYGGAAVDGFGTGLIFELKRDGSGFAASPSILSEFTFAPSGQAVPDGPLYRDAAGNLFATASVQIGDITGLVYELPFTNGAYASTPSTVAVMNGAIGAGSISAVSADAQGNLFGTAQYGGPGYWGSIFEVANTGTGYDSSARLLASFEAVTYSGSPTDFSPWSGVLVDGAGNLFGTAQSNGIGSLYVLPHQGAGYPSTPMNIAELYSPAHPAADSAGRLLTTAGYYGATYIVGLSGSGYVTPAADGAVTLAGANGALLAFPFADPTAPRAAADMLEGWVLSGAMVPLAHAADVRPDGAAGLLVVGAAGAVTVPAGFIGAAITAGAVTLAGGAADGQAVFAGSGGIAFDAGLGSGSVFAAGGDNLFSVQPGAGSQHILAGAGNDTVVLLAGDDTVDAGGGRNLILTGAGHDVVASNGDDLIAAGAIGAATIVAGANNPTVFLGPGTSRFIGGSGHATVVATSGTDSIASQGGSAIWLGSGSAMVTSGGSDTIIGGAGSATVASAGDALVFAGTGGLDFIGGAGSATVAGGAAGALTLRGGNGALLAAGSAGMTFLGGAGSATVASFGAALHAVAGAGGGVFLGGPAGGNAIAGGAGRSTLLGGGDGDVLRAGSGAGDVIVAGGGAETIIATGTAGAHLIYAGSGQDLILLGDGPANVLAGSGAATIQAGSGPVAIAIGQGGAGLGGAGLGGAARLTITHFTPAHDYLSLLGYPAGEAAAALAGAAATPAGEVLTLSDGTTILLAGFNGLGAGSFL